MANSSRVPEVLAYLVATLDAALPVNVYDGPAFGNDGESSWLEIGVDDPEFQGGSALTAATSRIEWTGLGARSRTEDITVNCAAWAWTGEDRLVVPRLTAYALAAEAEAVMYADPSMGGIALFGGVSNLTLRQGPGRDGSQAAVMFDVTCKARLSA